MNPAQEGKLHPEFQAVISSFAPHLPKSTLVVEDVFPCSVGGKHFWAANDSNGVCQMCGEERKYTAKPPQEEKCECEPNRPEGWENMTDIEQAAWESGYHFASDFARKQMEQRLEAMRRELGNANASHELLFRMMGERMPFEPAPTKEKA